jgi:hypothetical protein
LYNSPGRTAVLIIYWGSDIMYKQLILKLLEEIDSEEVFKLIYLFIKGMLD